MIQRGAHTVKQVLIKWDALPATMATWEDDAQAFVQLESSTARGQAIS